MVMVMGMGMQTNFILDLIIADGSAVDGRLLRRRGRRRRRDEG